MQKSPEVKDDATKNSRQPQESSSPEASDEEEIPTPKRMRASGRDGKSSANKKKSSPTHELSRRSPSKGNTKKPTQSESKVRAKRKTSK